MYGTNMNLMMIPRNKKKKKQNFIKIKDEFIVYNITIKDKIRCQCHNNNKYDLYCKHIYFLLNNIFGLSVITICFLNLKSVYAKFKEIYSSSCNDLNRILEDEIYNVLNNYECGICLEKLTKSKSYKIINKDVFECVKCKKMVHTKCMEKWINYKTKEYGTYKGCIYCRTQLETDTLWNT
jgi:hypothetical protein